MNVAILGLGVVGRGVYDILVNEHIGVNVKYVLEPDVSKCPGLEHLLAKSFSEIINDKEVEVVIELIGGTKVAYDFVKESLKQKKHVVTANKALISKYFQELSMLAYENNVHLLFEASVGGGIIILDALYKRSVINSIYKIEGILNGSTNYVLSKVFNENKTKDAALKEAYSLGYLEKGSDDDMDGTDASRKINILSTIAYQGFFCESNIMCSALSPLSDNVINYVKERALTMKYIAASEVTDEGTIIYVAPVIMKKTAVLANINNEYNIITTYGKYHKTESFIGQGAGRYPTATAVVFDIISIKEKQIKRNYRFTEKQINADIFRFRFLTETKECIKIKDYKTFKEMKNDKEVIFYAIISEDAYEEI